MPHYSTALDETPAIVAGVDPLPGQIPAPAPPAASVAPPVNPVPVARASRKATNKKPADPVDTTEIPDPHLPE